MLSFELYRKSEHEESAVKVCDRMRESMVGLSIVMYHERSSRQHSVSSARPASDWAIEE